MQNKIKYYVIPGNIEKKLFKLPKNIRDKFFSSLEMLLKNPHYPSLRHKKIQGSDLWEFSITMKYRALYAVEGNTIIIARVGKHEDVL